MIGDVLEEYGRDLLGLDLANDLGQVLGRSPLSVLTPSGAMNSIPYVAPKYPNASWVVMIWRCAGGSLAIVALTSVSTMAISARNLAAFVRITAGRVGRNQTVADVLDADPAIGETLPGMGIGDLGIGDLMGRAVFLLLHLARLDGFSGRYHPAVESGRFLKPLHPALQPEAIDDQDGGNGQSAGVAGRGFIDLGVAVGARVRPSPVTIRPAAEDDPTHNF
jgi:hypothetical protein